MKNVISTLILCSIIGLSGYAQNGINKDLNKKANEHQKGFEKEKKKVETNAEEIKKEVEETVDKEKEKIQERFGGSDGATLVGATDEDYEYLGMTKPDAGISLHKEAKKKGGSLSMEDMMKLSGVS